MVRFQSTIALCHELYRSGDARREKLRAELASKDYVLAKKRRAERWVFSVVCLYFVPCNRGERGAKLSISHMLSSGNRSAKELC